MSRQKRSHMQLTALLKERRERAERTRITLHRALDRFESHRTVNVPVGTKLTVRTLAEEAYVSKDTPLSKHRRGQHLSQYRFPDVVERFNRIKEKSKDKKQNMSVERQLRNDIENLYNYTKAQAREQNRLQAELTDALKTIRALEKSNAAIRAENDHLHSENERLKRENSLIVLRRS